MKRNWLLYLVIFSLALNLGTIGAFAYLRYQDRQGVAGKEEPQPVGLRDLWLALRLDQEQRQTLGRLAPEHRQRIHQLRREMMAKRQELFNLLKGENPQWSAIQAKIREISAKQGQLEEEVARFLLECKRHLRPEQQEAFINLVDRRLRRHHHGGRWGGGMRGHRGPPGGQGMGQGPGMGGGPGPHGCPPSPPATGD
jgi:Spy/CpxP family protein refolding chaperone